MGEPGTDKDYFPALLTAEDFAGRALAMFLEEPVSDPVLTPICCQASGSVLVKDADSLFDSLADL